MDQNTIIVSQKGLEELQTELTKRKTATREEIANRIEKARQQGDLSENASYKAALEEKEFNETKILELEELLKNAQVQAENVNKNVIGLGSKVKVLNMALNKKSILELVGENETDPTIGKISLVSPLGKILVGKKKGDEVSLKLPSGETRYDILEIL